MHRVPVRVWPLLLLVLVTLASTACRYVRVEGNAMAPTLGDGERVSVSGSVDPVQRGDIIVFDYPRDRSKTFLKRVVALPGEEVEVTDRGVTINGRPLEEPYVEDANRSASHWGPTRVPAGEYFVLGDNRRNSSDSRHWGTVPRELIRGKVPPN